MHFEDENRINAKKQLEKMEEQQRAEQEKQEPPKQSIYDESVCMEGKSHTFVRKTIEDLGISMYMPEIFRLMTMDEKEIAFPRTKPPKYAYLGDDIPFSIAVNITESPLQINQVKPFLNFSPKLIENMVPKAKVLRTYLTEDEEFPVGNAEFLSMGFAGMIYNLMLFASVNEQLVVICMSFENKDKKTLLPIMQEMAQSLKPEVVSNESDYI